MTITLSKPIRSTFTSKKNREKNLHSKNKNNKNNNNN